MKRELPGRSMRLVLAAYAAAAMLHADRVPLWCMAAAGIAVLWRLAQQRGWIALPGSVLRIGLALLLTASIFLTFRSFTGLAAGSALLLSMGAVKLLETRRTRDAVIVVIVALVLLLAACLERGNLPRLPLYAVCGWISLSALVALGSRESLPLRQTFAESGRALLWGLPLAVLLFLFVPRLPGALWSVPGAGGARTGLDDQMSPGSITELALSDEPAFRVRFTSGRPPRPEQLYWRGPVLHQFDGTTWTRGPFGVRQPVDVLGPPVDYEVILEPSGRNWWFGLESIDGISRRGAFLSWDGQLIAMLPVTSSLFYSARSYPQVRTRGPLPLTTRRMDTQLVPGRNPRAVELAARLRAEAGSDSAYLNRVLELLRSGGFRYTLTPAPLGPEPVDSLLFETREGFCGHFASAFVVLMRAAGVPARVVTGYLGGEWNDIGDYLLVRQSAAHAWTEVWLEERGWVRVDPTAVVTPERLQRGLDDLLPERGSAASRWRHQSEFFRNLVAGWDAANHWWQERVLNFNLAAQQDLLARLGLPNADYRTLAFLLLAGATLWAIVAGWLLARRAPKSGDADPLGQLWEALRQQARRGGLALAAHEPPRAVASRIGATWPAAAPETARFAEDYLRLRFGPHEASPMALRDLRQRLIRLRRDLRARPLLDAFADLAGRVPLYDRMPLSLRPRVAALAHQFQRRVRFTGCGGLVLTPFMARAIAFTACVPVVNRSLGLYAGLRSVLVYPDQFVVNVESEDEAGVVTTGTDMLSGQAEDTSRVLLSWRDVELGLAHDDGYDVVLHEFAHVIDHHLDGQLTNPGEGDADWHALLADEYAALGAAVDAGRPTLIDPYGAEDLVEFFAVSTETFFGLPAALRTQHPGLYAALARLYQLDPAAWPESD